MNGILGVNDEFLLFVHKDEEEDPLPLIEPLATIVDDDADADDCCCKYVVALHDPVEWTVTSDIHRDNDEGCCILNADGAVLEIEESGDI